MSRIRKFLWAVVESFDQPAMLVPLFVAGT